MLLGAVAASRFNAAIVVVPAFASWNPARVGPNVMLSNSNRTAELGSGEYNMVAMTNPVDVTGSTIYYIEFSIDDIAEDIPTTYIGYGMLISTGPTDQYLGAYANEFSCWWDTTTDGFSGSVFEIVGSMLDYQALAGSASRLMFAVALGKLYIGITGTGWFNATTGDFTGDPAAGVGAIVRDIPAGLWSMGASGVGSGFLAKTTAYTDPATWLATPPSGAVPFPA